MKCVEQCAFKKFSEHFNIDSRNFYTFLPKVAQKKFHKCTGIGDSFIMRTRLDRDENERQFHYCAPWWPVGFGLLGQDSPSSTITIFSTSRVFHWKSPSQRLRQQSLNIGESHPCFPFNLCIFLSFFIFFLGKTCLLVKIHNIQVKWLLTLCA